MKRKSILQLIIILVRVFIGSCFSNKARLSHQKMKNDSSITHMNHGYFDIRQDSIIPMIEELVVTKDAMKGWNL